MANPDDRRDIQEVLGSIVSKARAGPDAPESETTKAAAEPERQFEPESKKEEVMTPVGSGSEEETKSLTPSAASADLQGRASAGSARSPRDDDRPLMSPESDQAVHDAFSRLTATISLQKPRTIEDLVVEMIQPILKNWFDEHLPALVERLVQEEIRRVSSGRR